VKNKYKGKGRKRNKERKVDKKSMKEIEKGERKRGDKFREQGRKINKESGIERERERKKLK
jgi:hypothetical protein